MHTFTVLFQAPGTLVLEQVKDTLESKLASFKSVAAPATDSVLHITLTVSGEQALKQAVEQIKTLFASLKPLRVMDNTAHWEKGTLRLK